MRTATFYWALILAAITGFGCVTAALQEQYGYAFLFGAAFLASISLAAAEDDESEGD